jgi:hypothetical protein
MQVWIIPLSKEPQPANVLAEGKGYVEWMVEEGCQEFQLKTM